MTLPIVVRPSPGRVALVTAGLSVAGAAFGGFSGAAAFNLVIISQSGFHLGDLAISIIPGVIGAGLGAVLAPMAGWGFPTPSPPLLLATRCVILSERANAREAKDPAR